MLRALNWRLALKGGETQPQVFECDDDRDWVLKLPGNPHLGVGGLCADWIGTALATLAGLPVIECGFVEVGAEALSTIPQDEPTANWALPGTAFGTVHLPESRNVTGISAVLSIASPLELARIVVVDTWLDVLDRKKPAPGLWNLLIDTQSQPEQLRVIDFGLALSEVLGPPILSPPQLTVRCPSEWRPHLYAADVMTAIESVLGIQETAISQIIQAVPSDWLAGVPRLPSASAYLLDRRMALASAFGTGGYL